MTTVQAQPNPSSIPPQFTAKSLLNSSSIHSQIPPQLFHIFRSIIFFIFGVFIPGHISGNIFPRGILERLFGQQLFCLNILTRIAALSLATNVSAYEDGSLSDVVFSLRLEVQLLYLY